jgi:hypothetical protein
MNRIKHFVLLFLLLPVLSIPRTAPEYTVGYTTGRVVDYFTEKPVKGAIVTMHHDVAETDGNGMFAIKTSSSSILVRAHGYLRAEQNISMPLITSLPITAPALIRLVPFTPKALYLSFFGIGSSALREPALQLLEQTELNALVIDVKGDRGMISYQSAIPLASLIGAQKIITIRDMKGMMKKLKEKGVYTIARIVVFKDNLLAFSKPELSIRTPGGAIWLDKEQLAWVDPSRKEVWDYNIDIAEEAARLGFDEIQFDYVRFPDAVGVAFSVPNTEENRVNAITGFLREARQRLAPYNVFLAADLFGYISWNRNDTLIGQRIEDVAPLLDYLCPMLYPSGFQFGIPGYRLPVAHPYEIVSLTLKRGQERAGIPHNRFRPWIQAFRDYAFDRRPFTAREIRDQIDAAEKFGSNGWMLWNPQNRYTADGLKK